MTTIAKVAIGVAVIAGGFVVYKLIEKPTPVQTAAKPQATPPAAVVDGFLHLATSVFGYFSKPQPTAPVVPAVHGGGGSWDSSASLLTPLSPGETAYGDSSQNDYLLS